MAEDYILNAHNKEEFPPAHTAEHLLNQTMMRMFGCERSNNAHIERKKSKISYVLDHKPSRHEERDIERKMNELIEEDLPVSFEYVDRNNIPEGVSLERLPEDVSETLRLVCSTNGDGIEFLSFLSFLSFLLESGRWPFLAPSSWRRFPL